MSSIEAVSSHELARSLRELARKLETYDDFTIYDKPYIAIYYYRWMIDDKRLKASIAHLSNLLGQPLTYRVTHDDVVMEYTDGTLSVHLFANDTLMCEKREYVSTESVNVTEYVMPDGTIHKRTIKGQ